MEAWRVSGVPIANCGGSNVTSVVEWCIRAVMALFRHLPDADAAERREEWPQTTIGGRELAGSQVGIIGTGRIGQRAAAAFSALGCDVVYFSRSPQTVLFAWPVSLFELLAGSAVVLVAVPLASPTTHGLAGGSRTRVREE